MAHPLKRDASDAHNSKLRRMTRHYGSASGPANNRLAPMENLKDEGPEDHVGFGADYAAATARSDKPARRAVVANPVATYKKGGKIKPVEIATRARGGRLKGKGKGSTHVNVIVAPQGAQQPPAGPANPQLAALAAAAGPKPPMPPGPPPGAPPMGAGAPPMMPRKRGGRANHPDEAQDKQLINRVLKQEGLERERARGGMVDISSVKSGAESGPGRLEKASLHRRHKKDMKPQAI